MRKVLGCFLIVVVSLVSSCISLEEDKIENAQVEVTSIHPTEKYIGIKIADKNIKIHVPRYTKITKGGRDIGFSDLNVGDKLNLSYVKRFDLWGFGEAYAAKTIKVVE